LASKSLLFEKSSKNFSLNKRREGDGQDSYRADQRGQNATLHAVCDGKGRPIIMLLSEGQMSDHKRTRLMFDALPPAKDLLGDQGYDSDRFRVASVSKSITPRIPPRQNRKIQHTYAATLDRQRHKIENMFGRIKDRCRIATRNNRCADTFMSAMTIAATVIFWINQ
jgi:putative transposase